MIVLSDLRGNHGRSSVKKGDREASSTPDRTFATVAIGTAMTPINHVFSTDRHGAL